MRAPFFARSMAMARPRRFAEPVINVTLARMSINKTVIITGASRGIGYTIAKRFHDGGANVVLCGRSIDQLKQHELEFGKDRAMAIDVDVRDRKSVEGAVERAIQRFQKI